MTLSTERRLGWLPKMDGTAKFGWGLKGFRETWEWWLRNLRVGASLDLAAVGTLGLR